MEINFKIKAKPFSVNNAYYKNRQLTQACRDWRAIMLMQLQASSIQKQFNAFRDLFDPNLHYISATYKFLLPRSKLFTNAGHISKRSMDLDNCIKLVQDNVCDHRFTGRIIQDFTIKNLDIDDKFICDFFTSKRLSPNDEYYIQISYKLQDLKDLKDT